MARAGAVRGALAGAWFGVLMAGAPGAMAENPFPPTIDRSGRTLTTETTNPFPDPAGYRYSWFRCSSPAPTSCNQVPGATAPTYVLRTADIGLRIRSRTTDSANDASPLSDDTDPINASPPLNTVAPKLSGTARAGSSMRVTPGTWSGRVAGDPGLTYTWQRCRSAAASSCTNVAGARGIAHELGAADVGRWIRVVVGAEGLGRSEVAAPPKPIGPVLAGPPPTARLARLSPFPVLVIAGRLRGSTTRITDFVVRGPRRARVSVRCKGRRCPFGRIGGTIGRRKRLRFRRAQRAFRAGQVLEVRVTGRRRVGKFTRVRFRRGRPPRRSDLCLAPGAKRPARCSEI